MFLRLQMQESEALTWLALQKTLHLNTTVNLSSNDAEAAVVGSSQCMLLVKPKSSIKAYLPLGPNTTVKRSSRSIKISFLRSFCAPDVKQNQMRAMKRHRQTDRQRKKVRGEGGRRGVQNKPRLLKQMHVPSKETMAPFAATCTSDCVLSDMGLLGAVLGTLLRCKSKKSQKSKAIKTE